MYDYHNFYKEQKHRGAPRRALKAFLAVLLVICIVALTSLATVKIYSDILSEKLLSGDLNTDASSDRDEEDGLGSTSIDLSAYDFDIVPSEVAGKVISSVVCIQNYRNSQQGGIGSPSGTGVTLAAEGSGIVYSEEGYVITNAHVVAGADLLKVVASDGEIYEATLIGSDSETDLALIKVEAANLTPATLGSSDGLLVGDFVMAVGNPGGLEFSSSVTLGIVSAKNRPLQIENGYTMSTIQTDAAINPGNSGGALVNMKGEVVGICSAKYVAEGFEGLGFAIEIDEALPIIEELKEHGKVVGRSMLGISGMIVDELTAYYYRLTEGFYIRSIENTGAGDLQVGDVITKIDGKQILSKSDVKNAIQNKAPGTAVTIEYYRNGNTYETALTLISAG